MLTYAFKVLNQRNYEEVETETFDNVYNLFAEILIKGVQKQVKQGLYKKYVDKQENLPTIRGRINIRESMKNKIQKRQLLMCEYDELTEDNIYNQIIKSTMLVLMRESSVAEERKIKLKQLLLHFSKVQAVDLQSIEWRYLKIQRNNQTYQLLLNICYFVIDGLLLTTEKGTFKSPMFSDENINLLFERFVFNYYKEELQGIKVHAPHIDWHLSEEFFNEDSSFLPQMQTDIVLSRDEQKLIIDTKFYSYPLSEHDKLSSGNLYQIFSYVKNEDVNHTGEVSGLLLYAQTEADIHPDFNFEMSGNQISVKTLNLNQNFEGIKAELNQIVVERFGAESKIKSI